MTSALETLYLNRPIEDEDYTFEQWSKVRSLRNKSDLERKTECNPVALYRDIVAVGDPVSFTIGDNTTKKLAGYVINVRSPKDRWKKAVDISSALGTFENMGMDHVWFRHIEDMSDVEIPEVLKNISTDRLLKVYKSVLRTDSYGHINGTGYPQHVLKAELGTREHVFSKEDKKIMKKK